MEQDNIPVAKPVQTPSSEPVQTASSRAIAALILGILSLVCMGFTTGIPAIILGSMELKAIKSGTSPKVGEGVAKIGYILGIIGTVLTCLVALAFAVLIALGISLGTLEAIKGAATSV